MKTALLAAAVFTAALLPAHALAMSETVMVAEDAVSERFTVEILGDGARDAILIPGLLSPRSVWEGQTDTLLAAGYRVHLVQVNGFGGTGPGKNAQGPVLPFLVRDLARYIEAEGLSNVRVIGHSMGGFTGLNLALDRPDLVEAIMIIDSLPFFSILMGMQDAEAAKPQAAALRDMMAAQAATDLPQPDCAAPSAQARGMAKTSEAQCKVDRYSATADLAVGGNLMYDLMTTDLRPSLSRLKVPVTMLYPVDPPAVTAEAAQAIYPVQYKGTPDITFVPIAGARHFVMLDQPAATNAALQTFLAD
ncbi:MAG: putative hydrolases or acyltransferases (alpha/beta hydrolase superfamily) [Porphyrobacter sp. HL-46]|nr:MAG: putative hydrolases or acyltransferases (alpha/beta hydrolase superfamily) [Porphyrobacter sp. HL-46]